MNKKYSVFIYENNEQKILQFSSFEAAESFIIEQYMNIIEENIKVNKLNTYIRCNKNYKNEILGYEIHEILKQYEIKEGDYFCE